MVEMQLDVICLSELYSYYKLWIIIIVGKIYWSDSINAGHALG